ncbi:hypothetical protein [Streptomyces nojiriensis]|uniref:hypothetical protein n=1 Tax=Streptomyces nojiriensis TaxID=66374 RepID=UPI0035D7A9C2
MAALARAAAEPPPHDPASCLARARGPRRPGRTRLIAHLVAGPAGFWGARDVLRPARVLLQAAQAVPGHPHADAVAQLREALINAGEVDVARPAVD